MASYGYNPDIADVIRPLGQSKVSKKETGFRTIPDVNVNTTTAQKRLNTKNIMTGQINGNQQIRGQIQIKDRQNRTVMIMGYEEGGF